MDDRFSITATLLRAEVRPRTIKHGDTFAVFDPCGDVGAHGAGEEGIYHEDTRYLSRLEMRVGDSRPSLLSSAIDDDGVLNVDLTNPGLYVDDRLVTPKDSVHIHRSKVLWRGACYEKLDIHSKFRPSDA